MDLMDQIWLTAVIIVGGIVVAVHCILNELLVF